MGSEASGLLVNGSPGGVFDFCSVGCWAEVIGAKLVNGEFSGGVVEVIFLRPSGKKVASNCNHVDGAAGGDNCCLMIAFFAESTDFP